MDTLATKYQYYRQYRYLFRFRMMDDFFCGKKIDKSQLCPMERFSSFLWNVSFPEIKFFRKFPQQFSPDFDTILIEHCSQFSFLQDIHIFSLISHLISTFLQSVNKVLKNFLKNLRVFFFLIFRLFFKFYIKFIIFLKNFSKY